MRPFADDEQRCCRRLARAVFRLFTFDFYIRTTVSVFLFVALSSMLETYSMSTPAASIAVSYAVLAALCAFVCLAAQQWHATRRSQALRLTSRCRELFPELRHNTTAGLYTAAELVRVA